MKAGLTKDQVNKKYKNVYVEIRETYDWDKRITLYDIIRTSRTIRENTTLGQDVGTALEYTR